MLLLLVLETAYFFFSQCFLLMLVVLYRYLGDCLLRIFYIKVQGTLATERIEWALQILVDFFMTFKRCFTVFKTCISSQKHLFGFRDLKNFSISSEAHNACIII